MMITSSCFVICLVLILLSTSNSLLSDDISVSSLSLIINRREAVTVVAPQEPLPRATADDSPPPSSRRYRNGYANILLFETHCFLCRIPFGPFLAPRRPHEARAPSSGAQRVINSDADACEMSSAAVAAAAPSGRALTGFIR